jgi:hypothetical protein
MRKGFSARWQTYCSHPSKLQILFSLTESAIARTLLAHRSWRITLCSSPYELLGQNIHAQHRSIAPRLGNQAR